MKKKNEREILFRCIDDPVPIWSVPGLRWIVEIWLPEMAYPIAQAWVCVPPPSQMFPMSPYVDMLHVMERERLEGHGTALLRAIIERWPDVVYDAASPEGEAFLDAISPILPTRKDHNDRSQTTEASPEIGHGNSGE